MSRFKLIGYLAIATTILPAALSISPERVKFLPFKSINQAIAQTQPTNQQQRRIALVIGNANYEVGKLGTPLNDATDMNAVLKELGFEVILLKDATKRQMDEAIDRFTRQMTQGSVGLFYYAGHGMQIEGENYLIPVNNGLIKVEPDVKSDAVPLGKILGRMDEAENAVNIVILDACRDNPFRGFKRSLSRGLTAVQTATGSLIAFATAPGKVADDGKGRNGLFTSFLLKHIKDPTDVDIMLRKVRAEVAKSTNNYQVPWNSSSLIGEFSFNVSPKVINSPVATPLPQPSPKPTVAVVTPQKPEQSTPSNQPRSLLISSSTGVDYTPLRELLSQKKWKEADQKTADLMLAAANRQKEGWIDENSANKFSCEDLRMMDREWLVASDGKFGFSVQLAIYKQTGKPFGSYQQALDDGAYDWRFGNLVGWRRDENWKNYSDLTWNTDAASMAPRGHLPWGWFVSWRLWFLGLGQGLFRGFNVAGFLICSAVLIWLIFVCFLSFGGDKVYRGGKRVKRVYWFTRVYQFNGKEIDVFSSNILGNVWMINSGLWLFLWTCYIVGIAAPERIPGSYHQSASARPNIYLAARCEL
ncbi:MULTISPECIES: caspase family protein [Microcystis]|jgi:hypothetical protein|uniref:caspase family protein n=1 Tax=Microcystis TaxID=1125 RepID=UPI001F1C635A|nr:MULTISPECIES: caspase family protein [Microcystis]MDB9398295.1 GUN4 domain-containing protein [Microcystis aeruginosa CS-573]